MWDKLIFAVIGIGVGLLIGLIVLWSSITGIFKRAKSEEKNLSEEAKEQSGELVRTFNKEFKSGQRNLIEVCKLSFYKGAEYGARRQRDFPQFRLLFEEGEDI